jgi:hypothetical protein
LRFRVGLVPGVFGLGAAADGDDEDDDGVGADAATGVDVGVEVDVGDHVGADVGAGVEVDVVDDVADVAEISATVSAVIFVFVVRAGVLIVRLFADMALGLVLVLAFPAGLGVGRALGFSLDFRRLAWALALGWLVGEGVLGLDFMGVVWRGLRGLVVTLSQCHSHAWELTVWRKQSTDSRFTGLSISP